MPSRAIARGSRRRYFVALGIGVFIASTLAWAPMLSATPATAHSSLIDTSPADGQELDRAPSEVSLQFSEELIDLGAIVRVVDAAGTDYADGEPVIDGSTVTAVVGGELPAGPSQIRWRVVSADGHPISGLVPFTVAGAGGITAAPASTTPPPTAAAESDAMVETGDDARPAQGLFPTVRIVLTAAVGAVLALAPFIAVRVVRRRSAARQRPDAHDQ